MPWKKKTSSGYLSPTVERSVRYALAHGESYETVRERFLTSERLFRESWEFWSKHIPTDLDEAALQQWIYGPFSPPASKPNSE